MAEYTKIVKALRVCLDINKSCNDCAYKGSLRCMKDLMYDAADAIEKMNQRIDFLMNCIHDEEDMLREHDAIPAADVVPVRHGRWVWDPDGMDWGIGAWCCSECKSRAETWWANDQKYNPLHCSGGHFCGNCGARMDGDGE